MHDILLCSHHSYKSRWRRQTPTIVHFFASQNSTIVVCSRRLLALLLLLKQRLETIADSEEAPLYQAMWSTDNDVRKGSSGFDPLFLGFLLKMECVVLVRFCNTTQKTLNHWSSARGVRSRSNSWDVAVTSLFLPIHSLSKYGRLYAMFCFSDWL